MVCTSRPSLDNEGVVTLSGNAIEQGGEQRHQIRPRAKASNGAIEQRHQIRPRVKASNGAIEQRHQLRPRVKASVSAIEQRHEVKTEVKTGVTTEVTTKVKTVRRRRRRAKGLRGKRQLRLAARYVLHLSSPGIRHSLKVG